MSPVDDDRGEAPRYLIEMKGGDAGTPDGPGGPGYIKISPVHPDQTPEDLLEEILRTPMNPDGSVTLRAPADPTWCACPCGRAGHSAAPANDAGTVDFHEMLKTDAAWGLRERLNAVIGRPYLSTQLAATLPADVLLRLTERLEHLIEEGVRRQIDAIHDDVTEVTRQTLARLAEQTDTKLRALRRERFGSNPSTRWGG